VDEEVKMIEETDLFMYNKENSQRGGNLVEDTKKQWSDETLKTVDRLCLFDDDFMSLVFDRNIEATEFLLNTIFERDDLKVIEVIGQREYKNPVVGGRCITIDIYAVDSEGKIYDIEVQRADSGAIPQRARFHSAMVDTRMLKEKQKFKEIEDSYIIFITQNDVLGEGLPLYHVERVITENNSFFEDGSHIIYVNGAYKNDDTPIGKLVHDFGCVRSADMYCDTLKKQVHYFKETEGGREIVCQIVENYAEEFAEQREEALLVDKIKVLMIKLNENAEQVMDLLDIPSDRWERYKALL
jgi:predicted transposase/invertase (TIGR01784 family)